STCWLTAPTCSPISTTASRPTVNSMPLRTCVWNPSWLTLTRYVPVLSDGAENRPASLVTTVRELPVPSLTIVTCVSASAAPEASFTEPEMVPVLTCANPNPTHNNIRTADVHNVRIVMTISSLCFFLDYCSRTGLGESSDDSFNCPCERQSVHA